MTEMQKHLKNNNIHLNTKWFTEKIKEIFKKILEVHKNACATYWNLWDTVKVVLTEKLMKIIAHIRKTSKLKYNKTV